MHMHHGCIWHHDAGSYTHLANDAVGIVLWATGLAPQFQQAGCNMDVVPKQQNAHVVLKHAPGAVCMHPLCISFDFGAKLEDEVASKPALQQGAHMCPAYTVLAFGVGVLEIDVL